MEAVKRDSKDAVSSILMLKLTALDVIYLTVQPTLVSVPVGDDCLVSSFNFRTKNSEEVRNECRSGVQLENLGFLQLI